MTHLADIAAEEFAPVIAEGRAFGEAIARDAGCTKSLRGFSRIGRLSRLGLSPRDSLAERIAIYEMLGYIDSNLAAALPGPVMVGFAMHALADPGQLAGFVTAFEAEPLWSSFLLTEPQAGSDAASIVTEARPHRGGWRLNGRKYMIGQGITADVALVFARTGPGVLGTEAFLLRPAECPGYRARRLALTGCPGTNLSEVVLRDVDLPAEARLGRHLAPAERAARAVSSTFDAMRPGVAAIALGLARAALDRAVAEELVPHRWAEHDRLRLRALLTRLLEIGRAWDGGVALSRQAGLAKAEAAALAGDILARLIAAVPPRAVLDHPWLRRSCRDAACFEYTEGVAAIHKLNGADLFRRDRGRHA